MLLTRLVEPPERSGEPRTADTRVLGRVSVVIPTMNEAENLPHVFAKLPSDVYEVVLVDGHSTDDTIAVAQQLRPDIKIVTQSGKGKGNALTCGFAACRGDIIVMIDADGSTDPAEIPRFIEALCDGADFVKGSRFVDGGGSDDLTSMRRRGNLALCGLVNLLFRTRYTDLCYGYNAFWSYCLDVLKIDCDGFEVETLMSVRAAKARLRIREVASYEFCRLHGSSKLNTFRDGWRVLRTIFLERLSRRGTAPTRRSEDLPCAA